jgi:hypothetical protein
LEYKSENVTFCSLQEFDLGPHIDTICLPQTAEDAALQQVNSSACVSMGWGKNNHSKL